MENGQLFTVKGSSDTFKVVQVPEASCNNCCAYGKDRLCQRMPFCYVSPAVIFVRLNSYQVRKAAKAGVFVEHFES